MKGVSVWDESSDRVHGAPHQCRYANSFLIEQDGYIVTEEFSKVLFSYFCVVQILAEEMLSNLAVHKIFAEAYRIFPFCIFS